MVLLCKLLYATKPSFSLMRASVEKKFSECRFLYYDIAEAVVTRSMRLDSFAHGSLKLRSRSWLPYMNHHLTPRLPVLEVLKASGERI